MPRFWIQYGGYPLNEKNAVSSDEIRPIGCREDERGTEKRTRRRKGGGGRGGGSKN